MPRQYREDGERIVKLQGGVWVRRPQASRYEPSRWQQAIDLLPEIIGSLAVLVLVGLAFWLWMAIAVASQS